MNSFRASRRARWCIAATVAVLCLLMDPQSIPAAAAQSEPTPEPVASPAPELAVYIVQAGDTLYDIATRFGIAVELLATTNQIEDPNRLNIGQRLVIPPQVSSPPSGYSHQVRPGETLRSVGIGHQVAERELSEANHLVRADQLVIGQMLLIPNRTDPAKALSGESHTLAEGENLVEVALEYGLRPWALAQVNLLPSPLFAPPGTHLWIPDEEGTHAYLDWPEPFVSVDLSPVPAVPGETLSIHITLTLPFSVTGAALGSPLVFFPDGESHVALTGISAIADQVVATVIITATAPDGSAVRIAQRVPVQESEYGSETISVPEEIAAQMTPESVDEEDQLLADLFAARTPVRMWDGLFALPAAGDITSAFGTRRTYNIPNGSAYHTGTDFGRMLGAPVYAPADGIVVFTGTLAVRGNAVVLDHGWGVMTGYWHLAAIHVQPGDVVTQGQHLGDIGSTGLSTGPHLHWEMRVSGVPVNGLQWVREEFP